MARPSHSANQSANPSANPSATPTRKAAPKPPKRAKTPVETPDVAALLSEFERNASSKFRAELSARYGIVTKDRALGTPMAKIKRIAKGLRPDHALAEALWQTGVYEARLLASLVDEPERVTATQMNRWAKDFDNWAVVDTLCFNLFDRTPHAFARVASWSKSKDEFGKRAAFALLASLALHGRGADEDFLRALPFIEYASGDERNFVKKGVSWALRAIGRKKSQKLRAEARALAERLAKSEQPAARWTGRDALRAFVKQA
jgi:3-methyladenine DNA glycosylase AlkD